MTRVDCVESDTDVPSCQRAQLPRPLYVLERAERQGKSMLSITLLPLPPMRAEQKGKSMLSFFQKKKVLEPLEPPQQSSISSAMHKDKVYTSAAAQVRAAWRVHPATFNTPMRGSPGGRQGAGWAGAQPRR